MYFDVLGVQRTFGFESFFSLFFFVDRHNSVAIGTSENDSIQMERKHRDYLTAIYSCSFLSLSLSLSLALIYYIISEFCVWNTAAEQLKWITLCFSKIMMIVYMYGIPIQSFILMFKTIKMRCVFIDKLNKYARVRVYVCVYAFFVLYSMCQCCGTK